MNVIYKEVIDSTSSEAKRQAEAGAPHGTLVVAEHQTQGRGRRGRGWNSEKGDGIWMSFVLRPEIKPENASCLTLAAAVAVSRGIEKVTGLKAEIKWPNDLVLNGKKICGILTEMSSEPDRIRYVILGIGINVNRKAFPEELPYATSLQIEGGRAYEREELFWQVVSEVSACYADVIKTENLDRLLTDYNKRLVNRDCPVKIIKETETMLGTARGVTAQGELLVETEDGIQKIVSGEVSVRGVYGYV